MKGFPEGWERGADFLEEQKGYDCLRAPVRPGQMWAQRLEEQKSPDKAGSHNIAGTEAQQHTGQKASTAPHQRSAAFGWGPGSLATAKRKGEGGAAGTFRGARPRLQGEGGEPEKS